MDSIERTYYVATLRGRPIGRNEREGFPDVTGRPHHFDVLLEAAVWARKHNERFTGNRWPADYGVRRVTETTVTAVARDIETEDL